MNKTPALAVALLLVVAGKAHGQACCAGATSFSPARLALHEDALAGVLLRASAVYGSFGRDRHFSSSKSGDNEVDLEQDVIGSVRLVRPLQVAFTIPIVETWRAVPGRSESGGDIGDVQLNLRYDVTFSGASRRIPGIAILAGGTFPTGRSTTAARSPLATDATGIGAYQVAGGAAVEQSFGPWLVNVTGSITWRSSVHAPGVEQQPGLQWSLFAALAYTVSNSVAVALTALYSAELDAKVNGVTADNSDRAYTRLALATGWEPINNFRLQASVFSDIPIVQLGHNQPTAAGASILLVRTW